MTGYYTNAEHDLPQHVQLGIKRIGDHFIESHGEWFLPLEHEEADPGLLERVISGLRVNAERLRTSGHGLALGVLALKGLRDRPDLITPSVVDRLVAMLERTTQDRPHHYWGINDYFEIVEQGATSVPSYETTLDMVKQAFQELNTVFPSKVIEEKKYHFSGEQIHGVTHAHALSELDRLGYGNVAKAGMSSHRAQIQLNRQLPEFLLSEEIKEPIVKSILAPEYWEKNYEDPHALKLPYAALDLLKRLPEKEREAAEYNTCKLLGTLGSFGREATNHAIQPNPESSER